MSHGDYEKEVDSESLRETDMRGTSMMNTLKRDEMYPIEQWSSIEGNMSIWGGGWYQGMGKLQLWKPLKRAEKCTQGPNNCPITDSLVSFVVEIMYDK